MMHIRQAVLLCYLQWLKQYYNYAYVSTIAVGLQIVDVEKARLMYKKPREAVIGGYDTVNNRCGDIVCGQPVDVVAYRSGYVLMTTMRGNVLIFNVNMPNMPTLASYTKLTDTHWRAGAVSDYTYIDSNGMTQTIDLAIVGGVSGRPILLDITDPVNPRQIGQVNDFTVGMAGVAISKSAKLAYITGPSAVYVVDIKDPAHPVLLNQVGAETYADGSSVSLPALRRIVEKDGWVYMADYGGMTSLQFVPLSMILEQNDSEEPFPGYRLPVKDYYPALGTKAVKVLAFTNADAISDYELIFVSKDNDNIWIGGMVDGKCAVDKSLSPGNAVGGFVPEGGSPNNGYCHLCIRWNGAIDAKLKDFQITLQAQKKGANISAFNPQVFKFAYRHNGNVTFGEVLRGEAVYAADAIPGVSADGEAPDRRKFDYVQELLNQVMPRKQKIYQEASATWTDNLAANNPLLEINGVFADDVADKIRLFRKSFKMGYPGSRIGNTNTSYNAQTKKYGADDNTTDTFRKLMKDYGHRRGNTSDAWINKVIDRETLVGKVEKTKETGAAEPDARINRADGAEPNDTGLYELYKNVVEVFNDRIIAEAKRYAGHTDSEQPHPTDEWWSRNNYGPKGCKPDPENPSASKNPCTDEHGDGMSYCFGCKQDIDAFNSTVTKCRPPAEGQVDPLYVGKIKESANCQATGGDEDKRYPGLFWNNEQRFFDRCTAKNNKCSADDRTKAKAYNPKYWAGIDCSGLVYRMLEKAKSEMINVITLPFTATNSCRYFYNYELVCKKISKSNPAKITDPQSGLTYNFGAGDGQGANEDRYPLGSIRKGDLVSYYLHIATVYDDPKCDKNGNNCTYEIIHAYGANHYARTNPQTGKRGKPEFSRKVIKTADDISSTPIGFGRIKLWD